jgi:hypothetical protein
MQSFFPLLEETLVTDHLQGNLPAILPLDKAREGHERGTRGARRIRDVYATAAVLTLERRLCSTSFVSEPDG